VVMVNSNNNYNLVHSLCFVIGTSSSQMVSSNGNWTALRKLVLQVLGYGYLGIAVTVCTR
jgi:hypothetical protein